MLDLGLRANGHRDYPEEAVRRLGYVRTAQQLGFTLAETGASCLLRPAA